MLALVNAVAAWLLLLLLVGTSPFGMGVGVHRDQLLDPVLPHMHLRDGRVVPVTASAPISDPLPPAPGADQRGVAIGAGTAGLAVGIGTEAPALPVELRSSLNVPRRSLGAVPIETTAIPRGQTYAPLDPPPLLLT